MKMYDFFTHLFEILKVQHNQVYNQIQKIRKTFEACEKLVGEKYCLVALFNDDYFWAK